MENIFQANSQMLVVLRPLSKWRVLSLGELEEFANKRASYWYIQRLVSRFEKAKILKSFRDPWSGRKLVYFESLGKGLNGLDKMSPVNEETLLHDFKVSDLCRGLLKREIFREVLLEHELSKKHFLAGELSPDALIRGEKNKKAFSMALELELTRKASERIISKGKHYLNQGHIDYVLYFFCTETLFEAYKKTFMEALPEGWNNKIMLFWNPTLITKEILFSEGRGHFKGREFGFDEIF